MRRPSYREALRWLLLNDDTEWLNDARHGLSVSTALVADLFGVDDERIVADLLRLRERMRKAGEVS